MAVRTCTWIFALTLWEQKNTRNQEEGLLVIEVVISIIRVTPCKKMVGGAERSGAEALLLESSFFFIFYDFFCWVGNGMC